MRNYPLNFGPHVGFAYQLFGAKWGTVIRGSYGRYTFPEAVRNLLGVSQGQPFIQGFSYNNNLTSQDPDGITNYELRNAQNIFMGVNTPSSLSLHLDELCSSGHLWGWFQSRFSSHFVQEFNLRSSRPLRINRPCGSPTITRTATNMTHEFIPNATVSSLRWAYDTGTTPPTGGASTRGLPIFDDRAGTVGLQSIWQLRLPEQKRLVHR